MALGQAELEDFLRPLALFRGCDAPVLGKVARHLEAVEVPARATILQTGVAADALVFLARGRASVALVNAATGASTLLESLQAGDFAGEVGMLLGSVHPYALVADEACLVLRLRAEVFDALGSRFPAFNQALARRVAARFVQLSVAAARIKKVTGQEMPAVQVPNPVGPGAHVIPFVEVSEYDPPARVVGMVPGKIIQQYRLLPLRQSGRSLTVGLVNPRDATALNALRSVLHSVDVEAVAISMDDYAQAVVRLKIDGSRAVEATRGDLNTLAESLAFDVTDTEREAEKAVRVIGDEVIRLVNRIVAAGIQREASDIHIEPDPAGVKVRFRQHGVLQDWSEVVPTSLGRGLVARMKILAGMDITERRLPQDGRIGLTVGRREVDMRISTLPTSRGEKVVLRIFEAAGMMRPLDQVFVDPHTVGLVRKVLQRPFGALLVAGPTGSGKSSTMYSALYERRRVRPDSNIVMVEDPIEYRLPGVTQVQTNASIGLGFPQVLRAMLRQDPDVIAVGETRDAETARISLEAAMTGHLLFTSLHANDAIAVIQRLESLGCSRTMIAQSVALVLVQRLVRRLCQSCCKNDVPAPLLLESLVAKRLVDRSAGNVSLPRPVGCEACGQGGFAGRVAVLESLYLTDEVRDLLMAGAPLGDIERTALASKALVPFSWYASYLMSRRLIAATEALLALAD